MLNGEARVAGQTAVGGVAGTGAEIMVDFRGLGGGFTGKLYERPPEATAWKEANEITAESFFLEADDVSITR